MKQILKSSGLILMTVVSLEAANGQPRTFGEARRQYLNLRKSIVAGEGSAKLISSSYTSDGQTLVSTKSLLISFDKTGYTAKVHFDGTSGYQFKRTGPKGDVTYGHPENEDEVYFRASPFTLTRASFTFTRMDEKINSTRFLGDTPRFLTFSHDILAIGGLLVREASTIGLNDRLSSTDMKSFEGSSRGQDSTNSYIIDAENDFSIRFSSFKQDNIREEVEVKEFFRVSGHSFPKLSEMTFYKDNKLISKAVLSVSDITLNAKSKPLYSGLPENASITGFYNNSMYKTDKNGQMHFVTKKGFSQSAAPALGWLFLVSIATVFLSLGALVGHLWKRRKLTK